MERKYYEMSSLQNNSKALNSLGYLYLNGIGVNKDYQKAKYYFELTANFGNPNAYCSLGYILFNGFGN